MAAENPEVAKPNVILAEADEELPKMPVQRKKREYNIVDEDELAKKESKLPDDSERIDVEQAKQNILRMLGDAYFPVEQIKEHEDLTL